MLIKFKSGSLAVLFYHAYQLPGQRYQRGEDGKTVLLIALVHKRAFEHSLTSTLGTLSRALKSKLN